MSRKPKIIPPVTGGFNGVLAAIAAGHGVKKKHKMADQAASLGSHVKINATGEIVELICYDDREAQINSKKGLETVGLAEISRLTPDEDLERLKKIGS